MSTMTSSSGDQCKNRHAPFWLITKLKRAIIQWKKIMIQKITQNNWNFWTVNLIMRAKKIVNQSSDFPVCRTGSYRHKKSTVCQYHMIISIQNFVEPEISANWLPPVIYILMSAWQFLFRNTWKMQNCIINKCHRNCC